MHDHATNLITNGSMKCKNSALALTVPFYVGEIFRYFGRQYDFVRILDDWIPLEHEGLVFVQIGNNKKRKKREQVCRSLPSCFLTVQSYERDRRHPESQENRVGP